MRGFLAMAGDRTLAEERADQLFTPASVQKLVVATAALHYLGFDHQIETVMRADGPIGDGVLRGNLVLEAAGDPTWSSCSSTEDPAAPFRALADQVRRAGIARVDGDLVLDLGRFPGRQAPLSRSQVEMGLGFGAPVSGLAVDENTAEIRIAAGRRIGDRASVTTKAGDRSAQRHRHRRRHASRQGQCRVPAGSGARARCGSAASIRSARPRTRCA